MLIVGRQRWLARALDALGLQGLRPGVAETARPGHAAELARDVAGHGVWMVVAAEPLVTADRILFGRSAPLAGPSASMGVGMRQGVLAAFAEANRAGGVKGRKLELISKDDGHEPPRSVAATRELLEKDRMFALVGSAGTPNSAETLPVRAEGEAPRVGPYTGAAPDFVPLEGCLVGRLVIAALGRLSGVPTREAFLNAILSGAPIDFGGFALKCGAGDNQGPDRIFLTAIGPDGAFRAVDRLHKG